MRQRFVRISVLAIVSGLLTAVLVYYVAGWLPGAWAAVPSRDRNRSGGGNYASSAQEELRGEPQVAERVDEADADLIPEVFAGLALHHYVSGDEALASLNQLHGVDVGVQKAWIASYHGNGRMAMIWISEVEDEKKAGNL